MILFPAVDIKNGECVRLAQGREDQVTVFAADPVAQARRWADLGARFLHVVDLDGAFSGIPKNFELIRSICSSIDIPVQLGGGIRDIATAHKYIEAGVDRLIIGTMALESPDLFSDLCRALPGKIGVSLDAVDGRLKTKGWVEDAGLTMDDVLPRLERDGIRFIVYTDISRDGMQTGVNVAGLKALCAKTSVPVIAAGGVHTLDDIKALHPLCRDGLEGAISGRAIYVGTLDVREANAWIDAQAV
ncbi:MAG: 1-(5-phosphoribosyl)-5-[(5-phosphoribosylamino)methylideneamino]imidazole-4-carboxamide isomerase [Pseudodesulfovibrio sp.]|uniref:1-(5-phosphoribosyl)-5-[(5-phosphoribosylamino)methylideneamino] imidazole-4-carboxamide isomerase n=1 Tax=Pseudodesulfovibrio aespoeensis (strain ATCC 700646 / DSM 10631 / Aspo-2) TaxID=643562 RepID=E6VUU4_PSEA9|nr:MULTISPECIES: 1-(5-phosphoribosyl)-5-[(5-phosphoribosylamino)methylideneamino]imidazole-4-carboxamide isomerase [Pseudodesulfovibrio]MBU4190967.1 1-(5-phosphoribosyl)-5-[(5-phosphoribosylamino)methylideneamino]imidazole-4-carboxamide isomerase [Pseudomonadota bacterium]ADU63452.1 phosphoribosylformimino-5-aminoimidazole carboxamide ribotide isomerase [Pseudodesulfovibrio aespoeensis Aspo-2]MBU4473833.1 1-(5-phosphoribosyl)-5-[(5-phosphoribosylamino)methylideneamino]imidazole-4-carboxamide iso